MKTQRYALLPLLFTLLLGSCGKFLDVKPKGVILPEKLADYEAMLNSPTLIETYPAQLIYASDDLQGLYSRNDRGSAANMYFWKPQIESNTEVSPPIWGQLYRVIYNCNVIINYVGSTAGPITKQNEVLGEALTIKADCYFSLLTVFAKQYDAATASSDPGLPLVNSTDVTSTTPARASLQATVDEIINDLKTAAQYLPATSPNKLRVNRYGAFAVLSRVYLYLGDYPNALLYANKALEVPHTLLNYNELPDRESMPIAELNPESLWVRLSQDWVVPGYMLYSANLLSYFSNDDLRLDYLTRDAIPKERTFPNGNVSMGVSFPELYLTKAEALVRQGDRTGAMEIVNMLREKRIRTATYVEISATSDEDALIKVLDERRRELAFSGQRWTDMKRLDKDGRMPEVRRLNVESQEVEGSLPPHSPNYVYEIPSRVLMFNPGMTRNH